MAFPANVVYDSKLKEFFFSNNGLNEIEAYSAVDGHRVGAVTVPGAMGLSLAPDGSRMAVGTNTPHIYFVNPATLHVTGQVEVPASVMDPNTGYEPVMPFLMATGAMLFEAAPPDSFLNSGGNLLSYDLASGAFAVANPPGAVIGVVNTVPARSLDGNYLAVPILGSADLQMAVYSAQSQTWIGSTPAQYGISAVAANADGSQFALVGTQNFGAPQTVTFWDRTLQQQGMYPSQDTYPVYSIVFSRDGKYLYFREMTDVLALNAQTGTVAGYQGLALGGWELGTLWDTDESGRVYGIAGSGAYVASLTHLQSTAPQMPQFDVTNGSAFPDEGPLSGGTKVQFTPNLPPATQTTDGIGSDAEAYFGVTPATSDAVTAQPTTSESYNVLTAAAPAASVTGPVNVVITDANNNAALLPAVFSYGPHTHWIDPSALSPDGGTISTLWADGLEYSGANNPTVTIGGAAAEIVPPNIIPAPVQQLLVKSPAGTGGWADLKLSLEDGTSETTRNLVQYLAQDVTVTSPAYTSIVYDSTRNRFYMAGADNTVGVFDPETRTLLQSMKSATVSPGAVLWSLALTPDNSRLLASDPADHSLVVFDLTTNTSAAVNVLLASDGTGAVEPPMPVAALSGNQAFVLLSPWVQNEVRQIDLAQLTVRVRTDVHNSSLFSVAPSTLAASAGGQTALLGGAGPSYSAPFYAWKYDAASDSFSEPMSLDYSLGDQVAVNADGTVLGLGTFTLARNLLPLVTFPDTGLSTLLPGSGALRYSAGNEVLISDTRSGKLLLSVAAPARGTFAAFAVDPTGQKILASCGSSLNYYQLAVVPLAVAAVTPGTAVPGATLTIRGSGFVAGTTATIAGTSASCSMVDDQTLTCSMPAVNAGLAPMTLSNPDGQTYSLEAAVRVK